MSLSYFYRLPSALALECVRVSCNLMIYKNATLLIDYTQLFTCRFIRELFDYLLNLFN